MPSAIAAGLSITLAICSPFVIAQTATPDPRVDQVDRVISLTGALVKGVEQCFNPSHTKGNTAVKNRLIKLEETAMSARSSLTGGDGKWWRNWGRNGTHFLRKRPLPPVFIATLSADAWSLALRDIQITHTVSP